MKPIDKDELYQNLSEFLKSKGVSLQDGSYSRGIQAGISFLADAINLSQAGINRAKSKIEKQLDHARQIIHDKTSPKSTRKARKTQSGRAAKVPKARLRRRSKAKGK